MQRTRRKNQWWRTGDFSPLLFIMLRPWKRRGNGDRFRMGLEGAKDESMESHVSTAERNQVLFQSRSAQAGSNQ
jgi:hypothetical protein